MVPAYIVKPLSLVLVLLTAIGFGAVSQSKTSVFRHLTTENGLASDLITHIAQDRQGYIWITTRNGLQRYDGFRFVTYRADLHNPDALQTDWLTTVFEDSRGRLWIGSDLEAPYLFDRATGKFYNYNKHCRDKKNIITGVWRFLEDSNGDIWVSAKNGFFKLDKAANEFQNFNDLMGIAGNVKTRGAFAADRQGNIWYITSAGIRCYRQDVKKIYDEHNNPAGLAIFKVRAATTDILVDDHNNVWVDTYAPSLVYKFDLEAGRVKTYDLHNTTESGEASFPGIINKGPGGNIAVWLAGTGMAIYQPEKDEFSIKLIDNKNPYGLHASSERLNMNILIDRECNFWSGTDKGINIFNPARQYFSYYGFQSGYPNAGTFPAYIASGFLQSANGDVFVSYYHDHGGIFQLDSNLQIKKRYLVKWGNTNYNDKNQVWGLYRDPRGVIWAPNQDGTILKLDQRTGKLSDTVIRDLSGCINTMQQDENGDWWIGHWARGLIRMDHNTGKVQCFNNPPGALSYPLKNVLCIYQDEDSILWTGTNQGLFRFNKIKKAFTGVYVSGERDGRSISNNIINSIIPYNQDTLLIATAAGLNLFDKHKKIFSLISTKDGLPNNFVEIIAVDKHHDVWAGCVEGFCRINMTTHTVTTYGINDGIIHAHFECQGFTCLRNGNFLVSEQKGFICFNPDSVREKKPPLAPSITGVRVFDKEIRADSFINSRRSLTLPYMDNNITIEFASLQYAASDKFRYSYQLEGVDKSWAPAGRDQTARYNQLRSGHYLFRVKCTDRDGIEASGITLLPLYIVPPFWNTWWFYTCAGLLAAGGIFFAARWIDRRRKEKELMRLSYEKKIAVVEMNTLRAQMNPHFIFNSLNSINTFILKNDQENATDYLDKFSQLVRLILDNSRTEWVLLENEIKALKLYIELESLRCDNAFTCTFDIGEGVISSQVVVPPLIIQPYVENAIWHGLLHRQQPGGQIRIRIWKESNELKMQIIDNGVGRAEAARLEKRKKTRHRSHGMKITAERLAVVNEVYKVNARVMVTDAGDDQTGATGTKVLLTIQYKTHAGINH